MSDTTEPMTFDSAVDSLLMPQETEHPEEVEQEEDVSEEVTDEQEEDAEGEYEEEGEELESEGELEAEDGDGEEEEAEEQPERFSVKVDGADVEVTLEELTQSFSGQKYIQKGMQEAAAAKKQAETVFVALQQEQARIAELYKTMQEGGVVQSPQAPDLRMAHEDPIGYIAAKAEYDAKKQVFDAQQVELSQVTQAQTQAQQQAMSAYMEEQKLVLNREIPDFADPVKGKQVMSDLRSTGQSYGFSEAEIGGITDARTVKVLHDAMQWRRLKEGKAAVGEKVKKARPMTKPKAPRKVNKKAQDEKAQRLRLKQTGSVDAAVDWLMNS